MKLRRYFATDMRQGLQMIREAQGSDVLILSNHKVEGGIELITADEYSAEELARYQKSAAVARSTPPATSAQPECSRARKDTGRHGGMTAAVTPGPDQVQAEPHREAANATAGGRRSGTGNGTPVVWTQEPLMQQMREEVQTLRQLLEQQVSGLAWGEMGRSHPIRASIMARLAGLGVTRELIAELCADIALDTPLEQAWQDSTARLRARLTLYSSPLLETGGVAALVGPSGVGKTTLIAKLASRFAMAHGPRDVALITTDTQRIGAREQLRSIGRIIGIPVWAVASRDDLHEALLNTVDRRLVLIDTAGMSHHDPRLGQHLRLIQDVSPQLHTYLTLSATTQTAALARAVEAFTGVSPVAAMATHLDEATSLGPLLSVLIRQGLPLAFVSAGQNIPEDLDLPDPHTLIEQMEALAPSFDRHEKVILDGLSNGDWMHANV